MKPEKLLLVLIFSSIFFNSKAQELNCEVILETDQVQASGTQIFKSMRQTIEDFLNNRNWTDETFKTNERITSNLIITITQMPSVNTFQANAQIQAARPVYNSDYTSLIFDHIDKQWQFKYNEGQPLQFNPNSFSSNLTSMLAFYAYIIIGMDYDTFGKFGGTPYFNTAMQIVNTAQSSGGSGWQALNNQNNRYHLADNLTSEQLKPFREGMYIYHRKGLDNMMDDKAKARKNIFTALQKIQKAYNNKPQAVLFRTFFNTKASEMADIFSKGDEELRQKAQRLLKDMDPTHSSTYNEITE